MQFDPNACVYCFFIYLNIASVADSDVLFVISVLQETHGSRRRSTIESYTLLCKVSFH